MPERARRWKNPAKSWRRVKPVSQRLGPCSIPSKKKVVNKPAPLPRAVDDAKRFLKDWERLSRSGRYDAHAELFDEEKSQFYFHGEIPPFDCFPAAASDDAPVACNALAGLDCACSFFIDGAAQLFPIRSLLDACGASKVHR